MVPDLTNLKLGIGDPWAGQVIEIPVFSDLVGDDSKTAGSLGFAEPIGSKNQSMKIGLHD